MQPTDDNRGKSVHVTNFQGVFGDNNQDIVQDLYMEVPVRDSHALAGVLKSQGVGEDELRSLEEAIRIDGDPKDGKLGPRVAEWVGEMVAKAGTGAWGVSVGAAGNFLGSVLSAYYGIGA